MRSIILRATTFFQLVAVIAILLGGWDAYRYWLGGGEQPLIAEAADLQPLSSTNHYVALSGGMREITQAYQVSTHGDGFGDEIATEYYVPVVVHAGDAPQLTYLIKQQHEPVVNDLFTETYATGYLQAVSLPGDLELVFRQQYHFSGPLLVLDTSYMPLPVLAKWMIVLLPMALLLLLVGLKSYLTRGMAGWWQRLDDLY